MENLNEIPQNVMLKSTSNAISNVSNSSSKVNLYIIVGEKNTRKSTIARCLCGCQYSHDIWRDMEDMLGNKFELFIERNSSLQEGTGIFPQDFVNKINGGVLHHTKKVIPNHILVLLRVRQAKNGSLTYPDAQRYIDVFEAQPNWVTRVLILLDNPAKGASFPKSSQTPTIINEPNVLTDAINKTAADIRLQLGWK